VVTGTHLYTDYVLYKLKIKQDTQCSYNLIVQRDKPIAALNERIS
jgi:hypothetical protein